MHRVENDFQKGYSKGAKSAAYTVFSAIIGDVSCLFSLALEFSTRFRHGRLNGDAGSVPCPVPFTLHYIENSV
jgi:hypothetical protein